MPLYFFYLSKLYVKNLLGILLGLSFAFAVIDYFQHFQKLDVAGNYQILYIFYVWQDALGLLYPLAIMFALIMSNISLVKHNTLSALLAFGFSKRRLVVPFIGIAFLIYLIFLLLHSTEFSYARQKAEQLLKNEIQMYNVNDLFFKYEDTFVYIKKLDPIAKRLDEITIFKVEGSQVRYTIHASVAYFDGEWWDAQDATLKTHIYRDNQLQRFEVEHKKSIKTLQGYKPKIIESLHEGKKLNILDAFYTWKLLREQHINTDKIRSAFYEKTVTPLFSIILLLIWFYKLPSHARMTNMSANIALALGSVIVVWGTLFGLARIGYNGTVLPEVAFVLPIVLLSLYAVYTLQLKKRVFKQ